MVIIIYFLVPMYTAAEVYSKFPGNSGGTTHLHGRGAARAFPLQSRDPPAGIILVTVTAVWQMAPKGGMRAILCPRVYFL